MAECRQLRLHRRTWFLERVLKLGLIQIAKEFECVRLFC
jgi:hypothetical protein